MVDILSIEACSNPLTLVIASISKIFISLNCLTKYQFQRNSYDTYPFLLDIELESIFLLDFIHSKSQVYLCFPKIFIRVTNI
jgi:hypothetical protein